MEYSRKHTSIEYVVGLKDAKLARTRMSFIDRLSRHLQCHCRCTSDQVVVVTLAGIQALPGVVGRPKSRLGHCFYYSINQFAVRQNEFSLAAIELGLAKLAIHVGDDWQRIVDRVWSTLLAMPRLDAGAAKPIASDTGIPARTLHAVFAAPPIAELQVVPLSSGDSSIVNNVARDDTPYASFTRDGLVRALVASDKTAVSLRAKFASTRYNLRNARCKIEVLEERLRAHCLSKADACKLAISKGPLDQRLTKQGCIALAVRRNCSNIAAADLGSVLLADISRWSVVRAEVSASLALQGSCANYWKHEAEQMERGAGLSVTSLTSDATGAGMWRKQKVSTCDLESSMLMRADGVDDEIVSIRRQADLVAVKRTNAEDTLAVLCKHLDSLGAPHFLNKPCNASVRVWLYTSDRGPDQIAMRKLIHKQLLALPNVLFFASDCMEHALHLIVKASVVLTDRWLRSMGRQYKYFSSLTKITQVWRDHTQDVYDVWVQRYGLESARECVSTLCPQCVAGRWGSIAKTESRFELLTMEKLHVVLSQVLKNKKAKKTLNPDQAVIDDVAFDEMVAYRSKMSKWARDSMEAASDTLFARLISVMHRACSPTIHASDSVKKHQDDGNREDRDGGGLAQLVSFKAAEIEREYCDLLSDDGWLSCIDGLSDSDANSLMALATLLVLQNAAAFNRRTSHLRTYPLILMRFAEKPMSEYCEVRKAMADDILSTADGNLESNTLKIKNLHKSELELVAASGHCPSRLYVAMLLVRRQFKSTVAVCERQNSMLKMMTRRSPNVGLPLLSARISLKSFLGSALSATAQKSIKCRLMGEALLDTCLEHVDNGNALRAKLALTRWDPPGILPLEDRPPVAPCTDDFVPASVERAHFHEWLLYSDCVEYSKHDNAEQLLAMSIADAVYVIAELCYTKGQRCRLASCSYRGDDIVIDKPLTFTTASAVFQAMFEDNNFKQAQVHVIPLVCNARGERRVVSASLMNPKHLLFELKKDTRKNK